MLGRLRMSTAEALELYIQIAERVFGLPSKEYQEGTFDGTTLENMLKEMIAARSPSGDPDERMLDINAEGSAGLAYVSYNLRVFVSPH